MRASRRGNVLLHVCYSMLLHEISFTTEWHGERGELSRGETKPAVCWSERATYHVVAVRPYSRCQLHPCRTRFLPSTGEDRAECRWGNGEGLIKNSKQRMRSKNSATHHHHFHVGKIITTLRTLNGWRVVVESTSCSSFPRETSDTLQTDLYCLCRN